MPARVELHELEQNRRGDVVGEIAGDSNRGRRDVELGEQRAQAIRCHVEEVALLDREVARRGGAQLARQIAIDLERDDALGTGRKRAASARRGRARFRGTSGRRPAQSRAAPCRPTGARENAGRTASAQKRRGSLSIARTPVFSPIACPRSPRSLPRSGRSSGRFRGSASRRWRRPGRRRRRTRVRAGPGRAGSDRASALP